ncbi:uncharacterized protein conserved in bacteria [Anaerolinea thermolimosa]|uniref:LamG domain-containing protein n=1 Tax=Anaerolinea thermolimosa TaxID=229919 RepID=UPI000781EAE9|nr:LamG domain-containing protein [Anaerolinea thermolimosa]GAP07130.1 uncharacterized protein conserved in bacteria [Anaerolinea thermolimosa]
MSVYPDSIRLYRLNVLAWEEITHYVIQEIELEWGFGENNPATRIADIGWMKFKLNNTGGEFNNLDKNFIRLVITYDGDEYVRFYGQVTDIKLIPSIKKLKVVEVTVSDWLDQLTRVPLNKIKDSTKRLNLIYRTGKRSDEVVQYILNTAFIPPQNTRIQPGINTFPAIFDTLSDSTYGYSELSKVALSELGYLYLRKDRVFGETLVFENMRGGVTDETPIPVQKSLSGKLSLEDGDFLLLEEGDFFLLNEAQSFLLDNTMTDIVLEYGDFFNQVTFKAYPKRVDTSPTVLFSLENPQKIASGETLTLRGSYKNAQSGTRITGKEMLQPEATTDYMMNSKADGTGTNLTSYLSVTAEYGTSEVIFTLKNNSSGTGYITKLNCRGYGIYAYDPVESIAEDTLSTQRYGYKSLQIDQPYQVNLDYGNLYAPSLLYEYKNPAIELKEVSFIANLNTQLMLAGLSLDIGDVIRIKNTQAGIDRPYRLQKVSVKIKPGGIMVIRWVVKVVHSLMLIPLLFQGAGYKQGVNFGYLPHTVNLNQKSWNVWVNLSSLSSPNAIMNIFNDEAGSSLRIQNDGKIRFYEKGESWPGVWTSNTSVSLNSWHMITVTRNGGTPADKPKIYLDGYEVAITEEVTQIGNLKDMTGCITMLGNIKTATVDYSFETDGSITDARIYNRVLSPAEILTLYNAGIGGEVVKEGLVFHAPFVMDVETYGYPWKGVVFDRIYRIAGIYHEVNPLFGGGL